MLAYVIAVKYCQAYDIRRTESQNLNASLLVLQLFLANPMKPGDSSRIKM